MLSKLQLDSFCFYWMALAGITFMILLFINAPYGKYVKSNWGPTISNKLGWIIMESISPICLSYFFWTGLLPKNYLLVLIYLLWVLHYFYRSFIFPIKTQTASKKMPIVIVLMATFFNCINGFTNGYYLGNFADYVQPSYFFQLPIIFGFILFFVGFYIHFTAAISNCSFSSNFPFGRSHLPFLKMNKISSYSLMTRPPAAIILTKLFKKDSLRKLKSSW